MHSSLSLFLSFVRVPEIHDGFRYRIFFAWSTTVGDLVELVVRELGLTKVLPVPGGGTLTYVVEEVWKDGDVESMFS